MSKDAVVYNVTGRPFQLTAVSVLSLINHYRSPQPLTILFSLENVQQPDIEFLSALPKILGKPQINVEAWTTTAKILAKVDADWEQRIQVDEETVMRLTLPRYFSNYDRLVLLTNNTLFYDDVTTIFTALRGDVALAGVPAVDALRADGQLDDHMIDPGVLAINVARYNELVTPDAIVAAAEQIGNNDNGSARLINGLVSTSCQILPMRYNAQVDAAWLAANGRGDNQLTSEYQARIVRQFGAAQLDAPFKHEVVRDDDDAEFWRVMMQLKRMSRDYLQSQDE